MKHDHLYINIANRIAYQIRQGIFKADDRLPSVRTLCQEYGISMNTAKRVYFELEAQSLIDARPQSGYFVSRSASSQLPLPDVSQPSFRSSSNEPNELISRVYATIGRKDLTLFSIGVPSGNLLPKAKLTKEIVQATRELKEGGTEYESLPGNLKLRQMVAARSLGWGGNLHEDDIITTNGGMHALSLCLMALAQPGDTIAIESPCYPGILQLAVSLGLHVLELPTHPVTGIELDALKKVVSTIKLCLLVPNFSTPLGSCMPDSHKKEVVSLLAAYDVPLIEDDIYGDLFFGSQRPKCCKSFDTAGNVIWCSSISKTLAPGYRVGWIAPGKYKQAILKLKLVHSISNVTIIQEAVANFLKTGRYDNHLRKLRQTLQSNYQQYSTTIADSFPEGTKISRPQGGLALWVDLDKRVDTAALYDRALRHHISIAPGRMFSLQDQFNSCMRLCIGLPWSETVQNKLRQLGQLAYIAVK